MAINAAGPGPTASGATGAMRILELLHGDDLDGAIDAGLAAFVPLPELDAGANAALVEARDRLLAAWAARERHRSRAARLERIALERQRARSARADAAPGGMPAEDGTEAPAVPAPRPALPAAAAAALARARARASGSGS